MASMRGLAAQPPTSTPPPGEVADRQAAEEARFHRDWADLARYRDANARLGPPAIGEQRVVFMGNSITEGFARHFETLFPGRP